MDTYDNLFPDTIFTTNIYSIRNDPPDYSKKE